MPPAQTGHHTNHRQLLTHHASTAHHGHALEPGLYCPSALVAPYHKGRDNTPNASILTMFCTHPHLVGSQSSTEKSDLTRQAGAPWPIMHVGDAWLAGAATPKRPPALILTHHPPTLHTTSPRVAYKQQTQQQQATTRLLQAAFPHPQVISAVRGSDLHPSNQLASHSTATAGRTTNRTCGIQQTHIPCCRQHNHTGHAGVARMGPAHHTASTGQ